MNIPTKEHFSSLPLPDQLDQLAQVDAKTRQSLILTARNSIVLTRALSTEMLLYTLKEVGLADSVELLALAAPEQVRDMIDLDCWRKDHLDDRRMLSWLMLLDEAGSGKLAEWLLHADNELLVFLVKSHLEVVRKADIEDDLGFDQTRYFTFDDQYLLRFLGEEEPILRLLLERLRVLDYDCYKNVLENSLFELESVLEEAALRWRNARLADRGYPSYDEAQELFRFFLPELISLDRYRRAARSPVRFAYDEELIPPNHALSLLGVSDSFLVRALSGLPTGDFELVSQELAYLTNQVVIAEACDPGELAEVRRCVELTHDYLNIGLASIAQSEESVASRLLHELTLRPFFQIGVNLIARLQQGFKQVDAHLRQSGIPHWIEYLDSPFREACLGVQRRPVRFFLGLATPGEILYQRFRTLSEVQQVETVLARVPLWFTAVQRWGLLPEGHATEGMTLAALWNTAFARWVVEERVTVRPLSRAELVVLQKRLRRRHLEEESATFVAAGSHYCQWTSEEEEAILALAAHARDKLREVLAVDAATADLRFIEGLLIATKG
jgi:hypothetical protein